MSRRGIGVAALIVGVGALVRRRLQTRADSGDSTSEPIANQAAEPAPSADAEFSNVVASDAGSQFEVESTADRAASVVASESFADEFESAIVEPAPGAVATVAESAAEPESVPTPQRIVLPSMPLAGTNTVVQPIEPTKESDPGNHAN